jgi:hypothetical protein
MVMKSAVLKEGRVKRMLEEDGGRGVRVLKALVEGGVLGGADGDGWRREVGEWVVKRLSGWVGGEEGVSALPSIYFKKLNLSVSLSHR